MGNCVVYAWNMDGSECMEFYRFQASNLIFYGMHVSYLNRVQQIPCIFLSNQIVCKENARKMPGTYPGMIHAISRHIPC